MAAREGFGELVGQSTPMQEVYGLVQKVARTAVSVLVTGESGTGKELVGRAIHRQSPRREGPFVAINCGALPETLLEAELFGHKRGAFTGASADREGLFEAADGGTLFLDEIGEVSSATQVRLLRVLQEGEVTRLGENQPRPVDARIIAATNRNLKAEVQEGRFREDLYFRLNVIPIRLPPLRQRREDILPLAEHFLRRHCQRHGRPLPALNPEARRLLLDYEWPGNVRELEHEMERVLTLGEPGEPVGPALLSEEVRGMGEPIRDELPGSDGTLKGRMEQVERRFLEEALGQNNWNQTRTAEVLGLTRQGLIKKLQRYGIRGKAGD
jgi:transcriptional regulator with PAS, ATPase and Fis domain